MIFSLYNYFVTKGKSYLQEDEGNQACDGGRRLSDRSVTARVVDYHGLPAARRLS